MSKKDKITSRLGEEGINNLGSKMVIKEYRNARDIDVYFPEYDWTFKHATYQHFKKGNVKCSYEPRYYSKGYLGEGKYSVSENDKLKREFKIWVSMLERCYDPKLQEKYPTYNGCIVEDNWLNFQHMCEWLDENYYEIPGEKMCLDKDILYKGNKIYSRETCIFVPQRINKLFTKRDNGRGENPIGVTLRKSGGYQAQCNDGYGKRIYLGTYPTKEEAFQVYKEYKEKVIKEVIDSYKGKIPEPHYSRLREAMYKYEVEIDD